MNINNLKRIFIKIEPIKIIFLVVLFSLIFFYPFFKNVIEYGYKLKEFLIIFYLFAAPFISFLSAFVNFVSDKGKENNLFKIKKFWFFLNSILLISLTIFLLLIWIPYLMNVFTSKYTMIDFFIIAILLISFFTHLATFNYSWTNYFFYSFKRIKKPLLIILMIILANITFFSSVAYCFVKKNIPINYSYTDFIFFVLSNGLLELDVSIYDKLTLIFLIIFNLILYFIIGILIIDSTTFTIKNKNKIVFDHPFDNLIKPNFVWNFENILMIKKFLNLIEEENVNLDQILMLKFQKQKKKLDLQKIIFKKEYEKYVEKFKTELKDNEINLNNLETIVKSKINKIIKNLTYKGWKEYYLFQKQFVSSDEKEKYKKEKLLDLEAKGYLHIKEKEEDNNLLIYLSKETLILSEKIKEIINAKLFKFIHCKSCKSKFNLGLIDEVTCCNKSKAKRNYYLDYGGKNDDLFKYDAPYIFKFKPPKLQKDVNKKSIEESLLKSYCEYKKIIIASEDPTKINQTFKNELFNFFGQTNINKFEEKIYLTKESKELHCYSIILNKRFHLSENDFEDLINKYQSNYYSNDSYWKFFSKRNHDLRYEIVYLYSLDADNTIINTKN